MPYRVILSGLLVLMLLCISEQAHAQKKVRASVAIWPELQVTYGVGEAGFLFLRNQYRINTDSRFNDLEDSGLLSNFERIQFSLGYEHAFSEHWRGGLLWRHAAENYPTTNFYTFFLRHTGQVKSLYFNKQLTLEYLTREDQDDAARTYLMAELGKQLLVRNLRLTPSLSYDAAVFLNFKEETTTSDERFLDRTRLRLNLTFEASEKLHITPYFMRQTDYYYVEIPPVYDEDDVLQEEGYRTKRNRISPVVGLEVKYYINKTAAPASFTY